MGLRMQTADRRGPCSGDVSNLWHLKTQLALCSLWRSGTYAFEVAASDGHNIERAVYAIVVR